MTELKISERMITEKPAAEYHTDGGFLPKGFFAPIMSASDAVKLLTHSPADLYAAKFQQAPKQSTAQRYGSIMHAIALRDKPDEQLAILDVPDFRTKAAREARDAAIAEGRLPATVAEWENTFKPMSNIFNQVAQGHRLYPPGSFREVSIYWEAEHGVLCKARPDILPPLQYCQKDGAGLTDYKTTEKDFGTFKRSFFMSQGGALRVWHYISAVRAEYGFYPNYWLFIQQRTPPLFACQLYPINIGWALAYMSKQHGGDVQLAPDFVVKQSEIIASNAQFDASADGNDAVREIPISVMLEGRAAHLHAQKVWADCVKKDLWPAPAEVSLADITADMVRRSTDNYSAVRRDANGDISTAYSDKNFLGAGKPAEVAAEPAEQPAKPPEAVSSLAPAAPAEPSAPQPTQAAPPTSEPPNPQEKQDDERGSADSAPDIPDIADI